METRSCFHVVDKLKNGPMTPSPVYRRQCRYPWLGTYVAYLAHEDNLYWKERIDYRTCCWRLARCRLRIYTVIQAAACATQPCDRSRHGGCRVEATLATDRIYKS